MVPKYSLTFHEAQEPITSFVTKFGGQPAWYSEPQWPLSRSTGEPMEFICQIALDPHLFGDIPGRMAYIFMANDADEYVDFTWDPDAGENAVIIQPGSCDLPTKPLVEGPTLYTREYPSPEKKSWQVWKKSGEERISVPCEFAVELTPGEDPDSLIEDETVHASEEAWAAFTAYWNEDKIGGTPAFLQGVPQEKLLEKGNWRLILQLNGRDEPFFLNFGDAGIGYAFLSEDGTRGKFLWQCL